MMIKQSHQRRHIIPTVVLLAMVGTVSYLFFESQKVNRELLGTIDQFKVEVELLESALTAKSQEFDRTHLVSNALADKVERLQIEIQQIADNNEGLIEKSRLLLEKNRDLHTALNVEQRQAQSLIETNEKLQYYSERVNVAHLLLAESEADRIKLQDELVYLEERSRVDSENYLQQIDRLGAMNKDLKSQIEFVADELAVRKKEVTTLSQQLGDTVENLKRERAVNTAISIHKPTKGEDSSVLLRERERLIVANKELVNTLGLYEREKSQLREKNARLERDVLAFSQKLREAKLAQIRSGKRESDNKLIAKRVVEKEEQPLIIRNEQDIGD